MSTQTTPMDSEIKRNRKGRYIVLAGSAAVIGIGGGLCGYTGAALLFHTPMVSGLAGLAGFGLALSFGGTKLAQRSTISNRTTRAFVTIDSLRSLLGLGDVYVTYGPGEHISYWWESRQGDNNINLEEASQDFTFEVPCANGVLYGKGSFRLRPDLDNPVAFLTGVAAMAKELSDLVVAEIAPILVTKTVEEGQEMIKEVNDLLKTQFVTGKTAFETRFGVYVGDITVRELLPSVDVLKTKSALSEAEAIAAGTAIMLGGYTVEEVQQLRESGKISSGEYERAQQNFLSASGNLEGMDVSRSAQDFNLNISGLDPKTAKAFASAAQVYLAATQGKGGNQRKPSGGGTKKPTRRSPKPKGTNK